LEFLDYFVDPPRYTIQECIERGLTYSVPLKARLKLYCTDPEHEDFETIVQDVYWDNSYMTPSGTFVNGADVVVSQLHRSPGFSLDNLSMQWNKIIFCQSNSF
jgi:DNA-directed RNA polymerase subunit beta